MATDNAPLKPADVPDEWDFYKCRVDDAPGAIALNLWFRGHAPLAEAPHLYWVFIFMEDPGEHGMGTAEEAEHLFDVTDRLVTSAAKAGLHQVGRLRNKGCWQLTFYGEPGLEGALASTATDTVTEREHETGSKPDAEWGYYFDFLCPNAERWQWMLDLRVVESLGEVRGRG